MLVLQIITGILVFAGVIWGFLAFNNHCENRFDYKFFTVVSFFTVGASLLLIHLGNEWRLTSIQENGDILNGIVLMIIGGLVALTLGFFNFKNTNIAYGLGGSAVQLTVFGALAYLGIFILIVGLMLAIIGSLGAERVYVVNK